MIYTIDELKRKIQPIADRYNLPAVYVFGSYARGDATEDSDVDILVDTTGANIRGWEIGALYGDFHETFEKKVDIVTMGSLKKEERVIKHVPTFEESIMRERVLII